MIISKYLFSGWHPRLTIQRGRNLREIVFEGPQVVSIGRFAAFDYFGDGSFYLLDSPGHAVGHLCALARTTSDTFVLMGGDVCHYSGIMRPSKHLRLPDSISPHPCYPESSMIMCPGHAFEDLQKSRGREATDTLYDMTFGGDIPLAKKTVEGLQELDCNDNIMVVIAHDSYARDLLPHFPQNLNSWKEKGLGQKLRWSFLGDLKIYWKSQELA
jgi:glyoxylase-like metal-dependent hydrolase (beta-lactamase superfamily II)